MTTASPQCYIIAGPNGAGKTTFARKFLPGYAQCVHFVNADLVAAGLSPFAPVQAASAAARIVLKRIHELATTGDDFAFETTLTGRSYISFLRKLRDSGYAVHMFYLGIPSVELALSRIADRVQRGGHNVPEADVRRRFTRSSQNLFSVYRNLVDCLYFFDNSGVRPCLVFEVSHGKLQIHRQDIYDEIASEVQS
ncbi:MAG: zeta toxin family protein [Planctomycetota bacterium]